MMITRLLVANRGEIASRIFATCRRLGIETVAVHSPADASLPFVAEADSAVALAGNAPSVSYLDGAAIIAAAHAAGADAVHPGYGFLAESAAFARAVRAAGLVWVGPDPEAIEAMGDKVRAKALMREAGVPVLDSLLPEAVTAADLPVLVKAAAGGGGRGMRVVRSLAELPGALAEAAAEAQAAFGDGTVYVERFVVNGRHLEVQVVADRFDFIDILGVRDCSVQRRHQKVVEETPAPGLSEATRERLLRAALAATVAVEYVGAGTVEFLYDPIRDTFAFLEMNTRLQVEHAVTELVHEVDLVALQLGIAEGAKLPLLWSSTGEDPRGHAIEVRLYAEDPVDDYRPQAGRLITWDIPVEPGIRVDAGYAAGCEVTPFYDAMLAKVVAHAATREQAIRLLIGALRRTRIQGVRTNREQLLAILRHPDFRAAEVSTAWLEQLPTPAPGPDPVALLAAAGAHIADLSARRRVQGGVPAGWRNVSAGWHRLDLLADGRPEVVRWRGWPVIEAEGLGQVLAAHPIESGWRVLVESEGVRAHTDVAIGPLDRSGTRDLHVHTSNSYVLVQVPPRFTDPAARVGVGGLLAPMPGTIVSVAVLDGDLVEAGTPVVVIEAMKMQHTITAPDTGIVTGLVELGQQVATGQSLAVIEAHSQAAVGEEQS